MMDTPFNQTNYTSKLIEDQQSRTLGDVLSNDPSVTNASATASSGVEGFNIRGFSSSNGDVYFNGLSGIAPTYGSIMSMIGTERVEVLKGPNALLNGITPGGSIGGAINIVPKRAGAQPLTQFTPSYGSDGQGGGHIDVGRRFGEDKSIGVRLNAFYRNGDNAVERQSQETRVATLGLDFQGDFIRLSADGGYQFQHTSAIRRALRLATGVPVPDAPESRSNYSQPWSFLDVETLYGVVRGEVDIVENLTAYATFGAARSHFHELRSAVTVLDALGTIQTSAFEISNRDEKMALETGLRGSLATGFVHHDLTLANTISWEEGGTATGSGVVLPNSNLYDSAIFPKPSFAVLPPDPGDSPKWLEQQNSSLAVSDTMSVLDERIQLTVGIRHQQVNADNFDTTTGARASAYDENAITPAVGLIVKPLDQISIYANYIEGLSPGSVAPTTAANAGEVFPPTKTKQHEVGVKFDFGRLATTLSAFQIAQPNAFLDPTSNLFGVDGEQRNRGVELSVFGEVTSDVRVLGGVTYLDAELTKTQGGVNNGNEPAGVPKVRVTAGLEWDTPFAPGLTLSARGIYNGSSYLDQANTLKISAWSRFDLGARYSLEVYGTPVVVRANVLNIFDNDYWDAGGLSLSEPRTFLLSATVDF
jgi:iron complex outermembrane receptor protein